MRVPFIAGNWKMNTTLTEAIALVKTMRRELDEIGNVDKVLCPPFISLAAIGEILKGSSIKLGAQNLYFEEKGAYTGEISPLMLVDLCKFVIIGHSERRQYFNETGEIVNKKIVAALKAGLKPILCIGERLEENEAGSTEEIVTGQLKTSLTGINTISGLTIAYEPIWAIGTGKPCDIEEAQKIGLLIRKIVSKIYNQTISKNIRLLYGGSVNNKNAAGYIEEAGFQGLLVGGASLKAREFIEIVKKVI